ncbi:MULTISPECIES: RHS repeat-associated core domain-containing protein, partial [unclassified Rhizobium]|uniref:RHS repeat-associated core domain-containing protein n=1 Tax=unclassified Rhizobium TaxID=2613769 RepID=UPI00161A98AF
TSGLHEPSPIEARRVYQFFRVPWSSPRGSLHNRLSSAWKPTGIANTGLTSGQYTNFTFQTSPENFITGITQDSDASIAEPNPAAQTVAFNNLNETTKVSGQGYSYDANGNLLSDGERTYAWDGENRLVGTTYVSQAGKQTRFVYDGIGRRIEIDEIPAGGGNTVTFKYVWCGNRLCQARDAAYAPKQGYFTEGEFKIGTNDPLLFYGIDHIGSVRRVFQSATNAPAYDYDPWGVTVQTGPALTDYGFAGMFSHSESGLGLTWFRAYNANVGRWISRDPLGEGTSHTFNLYSYAKNAPVVYADRDGQISILPWLLRHQAPQPSLGMCPLPDDLSSQDPLGDLLGSDSAMAPPRGYWPLDTGAAEWGRRNGVPTREAKDKAHRAKQKDKGKARDDYGVDPGTGDIANPEGEVIGNLDD